MLPSPFRAAIGLKVSLIGGINLAVRCVAESIPRAIG